MSSLPVEPFPSQFHTSGTRTNTKNNPRACDSCRALKARCSPAADDSSAALLGQCQRCAAGGKNCVFTAPKRTRKKRTDVRVNELEKEVRTLTGLLTGELRQPAQKVEEARGRGGERDASVDSGDRTGQFYNDFGRAKRSRKSVTDGPEVLTQRPASPGYGQNEARPPLLLRSPEFQFSREEPTSTLSSSPNPDVIGRSIVSMEKAALLFDHYVNDLVPHRPLVVFKPGTSASSIRTHNPIVFLAVLAAAAGSLDQQLSTVLNDLILQVYADRIMVRGEKSLELIQAILVTTNWYYAPDTYEELHFYQYLHIAATMSLDIGLGQKMKARQGAARVRDRSVLDSESVDSRRTLLACYLCCASISVGFHRPNMFHWTTYMAESLDILETSPAAAATDSCLVAWIKLQRIMDACITSLHLDDPTIEADLSDPRIQLTLHTCSKQLDDWKKSTPILALNKTLSINYNYFTCILYELALYSDYDSEDFKPPYTIQRRPRRLRTSPDSNSNFTPTPSFVSSFITCLSGAHTLLDTFLTMHISDIRCSPVIVNVRMIYAITILMKIFFSASVQGASLSRVLDPDAVKVTFYLQLLIPKLKEAAWGENCRGAAKFLMVVAKLDEWYRNQLARGWHDLTVEEESEVIEPMRNLNVRIDDEADLMAPMNTVNTVPQRYAGASQSKTKLCSGDAGDFRVANGHQNNHLSLSDRNSSSLGSLSVSFTPEKPSTAQQSTVTTINSKNLPSTSMALPFDSFRDPDLYLGHEALDSDLCMDMTGTNTLSNLDGTDINTLNATNSLDDWMLSFVDSMGGGFNDWES